ncbi:DUF7522 family protein [Haloarchaeobius litoreus]|uniref:Uncharacterized protein n=1 Tax=Haloarchaeobius litoreus TaxID=755306 RepID=A0ABD6DNL8_9EURY|nr:hypothetical protein [Haloarchaeobius litoreus]
MVVSDELEERLVSTCRTGFGDTLRSVILFTPDEWTLSYVRSDLRELEPALRDVKAEIVENERLGFTSQETYHSFAGEAPEGETLGAYRFTVRAFDHGYLCRVIVGEVGVVATTDEMNIDTFEDVATTLRKLIAD